MAMKSDEAIAQLCAAMRDECGASCEFELDLGELVGKYRRRHDKAMRDVEAARLLPKGPDSAAEQLGVCRRAVYYMAERARKKVQAIA